VTDRPLLEGHISKAFDGALATLHVRVIEMGGLVLDQVREATRAYTDWEEEAAQRVMEREHDVNAYDRSIDSEQLLLIARRAPVAGDLRAIIAMSKCVAELERAGDEAKKIAKNVLGAGSHPGPATARDARHLGELAVSLLRLALEALDTIDAALCNEVIARDKDLDAEYAAGLRRLLSRAMEGPRHFEVTVEAAFVLKSLERIGDHARNLARHVLTIEA
jgi:phosphate transport system protein